MMRASNEKTNAELSAKNELPIGSLDAFRQEFKDESGLSEQSRINARRSLQRAALYFGFFY
jgi:hypothetical protein